MVQLSTSLLVASLVAIPALAAPMSQDASEEYYSRDFNDEFLAARDPQGGRFAGLGKVMNWVGGIGTIATIPSLFKSSSHPPPAQRDFLDDLDARDYDHAEDLSARDYIEELSARDYTEELSAREYIEQLDARDVLEELVYRAYVDNDMEAREILETALVTRDPWFKLGLKGAGKVLNWAGTLGTVASIPAMFRSSSRGFEDELEYRSYYDGSFDELD